MNTQHLANVPHLEPRPNNSQHKHRWYYYWGMACLTAVAAAILFAGGFIGYLTITEYRPADTEAAQKGTYDSALPYQGQPLRILTFNTGYAGLGKEADFIMDGGTGVNPESKTFVDKNMQGIDNILKKIDADIVMLQEVDMDSSRTFHENQWQHYDSTLDSYEGYFAANYVCNYVPYPINDPIRSVNSGLATYSRYDVSSAIRSSLPVPFKWPIRAANLKRCLLVTRMPIENSDKELVIVNLHLEAYDDGEGKLEQTRQLLNLLQEEYGKGNYIIAGGDFNQIFPDVHTDVKETSQWVPGLLDELPSEWTYIYDETTPTCRLLNQPFDPESELTQYYVIDGFIVSPNVEVVKVETQNENFEFSDHNPVLLEVKLK